MKRLMKKTGHVSGRLLSVLMAVMLVLSVCAVPTFAVENGTPAVSFVNTSSDGGDDAVSLSGPRTFKAMIPVDMTQAEAEAAAKTAVWSLLPDQSKTYLDASQYPNQTKGGPLTGWVCDDGKTPFFKDVESSAETKDGQVYLTVTFASNCYFGEDLSVPHLNGGSYMDVCGYFNLTAQSNGKNLGSAALKIAPYDDFHTMAEIYDEIDSMVDYAAEKTDLYVKKFSMGKSQGDNGLDSLDMPYLIVAKSKAAVDKWQSIKEQAENDPAGLIKKIENGSIGSYQVPVMYSNVHANEVSASDGVVNFGWMLLEAAAGDGKIDYDKLTGFTEEGKAELAKEMGTAGAKGSVAIPDLVKDTATYLGYLHLDNIQENDWGANFYSGPIDLEKYYTIATETVDVDELLDDVFFILVPEENVEGRTYLTRTSSGGFDLNRDNSFQTQAETQNMTHLISQWNPVSFAEFHGRVEAFQCEPCDPPHEPNFEYDLLAEHLMTGGEALGIAAVANNEGHNSYVIPQRDYLSYTGEKNADGTNQTRWYDPWDDMSTSYTPQYAMLHGTVAYTVEVPAYNDHTAKAVAYGQLGQSDYIAANKDDYLLAQAKIYERGVTNANSNDYDLVGQWFCDQFDIEGAEADLFRPEYDGEGQNGNFYPECYIIPLDAENQSNLQAANDMMEWISRNGVKILITEKPVTYNGVEYPAGTMVVTMYQAKRSVANGALYDGTVITEWPVLYSEGITAFNKTRGFDMVTCAEPAAYKTIKAACGSFMDYDDYNNYAKEIKSSFTGDKDAKVIIMNASEDSTAAVNSLLKNGQAVSLITEGEYKGSFLCDYAAWQTVDNDYVVTAVGVAADKAPKAEKLTKAPLVYISGKPADNSEGFVKSTLVSGSYEYNYDRQAMELLGFQVTNDASKADLIIGAAALDDAAVTAVKSGTPYIGYGRRAIPSAAKLFADGALVRNTVSDNSMDALAYVTYPTESMITASYVAEGDDILYGYGAGYFAKVPEGSRVLVQLDGSKEPLEGFLSSTGAHYKDFLNNSVQAISYKGAGAGGSNLDVVLFANTLTNKIHQRDEFNFISNAAFYSVMENKGTDGGTVSGYTDVSASAWYASAVQKVTEAGLMNGVGNNLFAPNDNLSRAMLAQTLYNMEKRPEVTGDATFTDVSDGSWYFSAVTWTASKAIVTGYGDGRFGPNDNITREQLAAMLYRYAGSPASEGTLDSFKDASSVSGYANDALCWAVEKGIVNGMGDATLAPKGLATRAQVAQMLTNYISLSA